MEYASRSRSAATAWLDNGSVVSVGIETPTVRSADWMAAPALERFSDHTLSMLIGPIEANARTPKHPRDTSSHHVWDKDDYYQAKHDEQSVLCFRWR
jgi:hypothetical protein